MLWMAVTSSASSDVSAGRTPGSLRASIVLPAPGGPIMRGLWPPTRGSARANVAYFFGFLAVFFGVVDAAVAAGAVFAFRRSGFFPTAT